MMLMHLWRSCRSLLRRPVVHLVVVATLALGIGAATAVFSLVHGVLLAPLPLRESARLMRVHDVTPQGAVFSTALPTYRDLRAIEAFDGIGAMSEITDGLVLSGEGAPVRVQAAAMTASLLHLLAPPTVRGRLLQLAVDEPGNVVREVVLSHRLWTERFGARDAIAGEVVRLNDQPYTVVGVLAPDAGFPTAADVWVPLSGSPAIVDMDGRDDRWLSVIARLRAGRSEGAAREQLQAFAERLAEVYPQAQAHWQIDLLPLQASLVSPPQRLVLWTLAGAVTCLLLLACANVAGLLLIEAIRRDGEFRLRAVLGASASRLAVQLLVESAALAAAGTVLGVALAYWLVALVRSQAVSLMPQLTRVSVDGTALSTSLVLAAVCCLLIGTAPGLRVATIDLNAGLGGAGQAIRAGRSRVRRALVVVEVGLAMTLLAGAALMATSFARLSATASGLDIRRVAAVPLDLSGARTAEASASLVQTIEARLADHPLVEAVGVTTTYPWRQFGFSNTVTPIEQASTAPPTGLLPAQWRAVTPGFFAAAGIAVLRGETFDDAVRADSPRVVVVSRTLVERLWPDADPIGRQILWGGTTGTPRTVIGVVDDIRDVRLDAPAEPLLFVPHAQTPVPTVTMLVKSRTSTDAVTPVVRDAWQALVPHLPVPEVTALASSRSAVTTRPRLAAAALSGMALIGVVLATSGIYALLAFSVAMRRRELAVRMAVGSSPAGVTRLVVADGLRLALAGIAIGATLSVVIGDAIRDAFYGVSATDPGVLTVVAAFLLMSALAASYLPARAAARTDPAEVLRSE